MGLTSLCPPLSLPREYVTLSRLLEFLCSYLKLLSIGHCLLDVFKLATILVIFLAVFLHQLFFYKTEIIILISNYFYISFMVIIPNMITSDPDQGS